MIPNTKNTLTTDHSVNLRFSEIVDRFHPDNDPGGSEFRGFVQYLSRRVIEEWDRGAPPKVGMTELDVICDFNFMKNSVMSFLPPDGDRRAIGLRGKGRSKIGCVFKANHQDTPTSKKGEWILCNFNKQNGSSVDAFFPHMGKVPITKKLNANYSETDSVYSFLLKASRSEGKYLDRLVTALRGDILNDTFFAYSMPEKSDPSARKLFPSAKNGDEWIKMFNLYPQETHGYWLQELKNAGKTSGYHSVDLDKDFLLVQKNGKTYTIRVFEMETRIFPAAFRALRLGSGLSVPVNFPPATAKSIWEYGMKLFLSKNPRWSSNVILYDPSMGWGGRLLGALCSKNDRRMPVHYIGTDPNPDNKQAYRDIYETWKDADSNRHSVFGSDDDILNSAEMHDSGSECFERLQPNSVAVVFTSPPYFSKEFYSPDPNQSAVKWGSSYESWRNGFLRPTLERAWKALLPGGVLFWNIANVRYDGDVELPLMDDSIAILNELSGFTKPTEIMHLELALMPGANRIDPVTGIPKCTHYAYPEPGKVVKVEPIMVYQKDL
jgi:hypothetical protein